MSVPWLLVPLPSYSSRARRSSIVQSVNSLRFATSPTESSSPGPMMIEFAGGGGHVVVFEWPGAVGEFGGIVKAVAVGITAAALINVAICGGYGA